MQALVKALGSIAAILALVAFPAAAGAEYLIPPGNSAANQYTEALPSGGGDRDADPDKRKSASPGRSLGASNARRLQQHSADGRAAAELAAATLPVPVAAAAGERDGLAAATGGGGGAQAKGGSGTGGGAVKDDGDDGAVAGELRAATLTGGDSGVGAVASEATGLGSGTLLPLMILATVTWAVLYLARRRRSTAR